MGTTTTLRKVGGSIMMAVPPALLSALEIAAGSTVTIEVTEGRMIVRPSHLKYTVEELLAGYDPATNRTPEVKQWLDAPAVGRELI